MSEEPKKTIDDVRKARQQERTLTKKDNKAPHLPPQKRNLQEYIDYSLDLPFECSSVIHIDDDAHYVLNKIKKKKDNVKVGRLVSALLKDFFDVHESELKVLLKKNKYL